VICGIILTHLISPRVIADVSRRPIVVTSSGLSSSDTSYLWCYSLSDEHTYGKKGDRLARYSYIFGVTGDYSVADEAEAYANWLAKLLDHGLQPNDFTVSCYAYDSVDLAKRQKTDSMADRKKDGDYRPVQMGYPENRSDRLDPDARAPL
jgi:hypothetical protein